MHYIFGCPSSFVVSAAKCPICSSLYETPQSHVFLGLLSILFRLYLKNYEDKLRQSAQTDLDTFTKELRSHLEARLQNLLNEKVLIVRIIMKLFEPFDQ